MKRCFVFFLLLLVLSAGGLVCAGISVNADCDTLEFTEVIYEGSPAAAEGLEMDLCLTSGSRLIWDVVLRPGGEAETDFSFHSERVRDIYAITNFGIHLDIYYDMDSGIFELEQPPEGIARAYWELAQDCLPGQELTREVRYRDYAEFYPICVNLDLPGFWYDYHNGEVSVTTTAGSGDSLINEIIADYFRIPVSETHIETLHIGKSADGHVRGWGGGSLSGYINLWTQSVTAADACYFTLTVSGDEGVVPDLSHIPGGLGIYRLPYSVNEDNTLTSVKADELATVFPLEDDVYVEALTSDASEGQLLLFTTEENSLYLTVIRISDMAELMKIRLFEYPEEGGGLFHVYECGDFIVAWGSGNHLAVLTQGEDGLWTREFLITPTGEDDILGSLSTQAQLAFDGRRLAIVQNILLADETDEMWYRYDSTGMRVMIYTEEGRQYHADYLCSLDRGDDKLDSQRCRTMKCTAALK